MYSYSTKEFQIKNLSNVWI